MKKRNTAVLMAALMLAVSVTGGCGKASQSQSVETPEETQMPTAAPEVITIEDEECLLAGAAGLSGVFNPLFAESEADKKVCELLFDTICEIDEMGNLTEGIGMIEKAPEDLEIPGTQEADSETEEEEAETFDYLLTLKKGLTFTDGSALTIDDVIFTWKTMADPYYDGAYTLADVPLQGMAEYVYDTEDVKKYKKKLSKKYSSGKISEEDFIAYLIDTKLNGWFDGKLPGNLDGAGTTWVQYLQAEGYDTTGIEEDADALLALLARCEYEHYSFSYDPYTYYQEKSYSELLEGGIEVADISGIIPVDDYSCVLRFTKDDALAVRSMVNVPVLCEEYYGEGFEKGGLDTLKAKNGAPMGNGAYVYDAYADDTILLKASAGSRTETASQYIKIKSMTEEEKIAALKSGEIALAQLNVTSVYEGGDNFKNLPVQGSGFYYVGMNTDMVNSPALRRAILHTVDASLLSESAENLMEYIPEEYRPQLRAEDLLPAKPQKWPMTCLNGFYPNMNSSTGTVTEDPYWEYSLTQASYRFSEAGYYSNGTELVRKGEPLVIHAGISEELPVSLKAILYKMQEDLNSMGVQMDITIYSEEELQTILPTAVLDLWIGEITDLADYDMTQYLEYGAEKNYFHHKDGYTSMLLKRMKEVETDAQRAVIIRELMEYVSDFAYCMPLCVEYSGVYTVNTDQADCEDISLNQYDSFEEVLKSIQKK